LSRGISFGSLDEVVEEGGSAWLAVISGVVSLPEEHGDELGAGFEVAAGLAGGVHAASATPA
jgi:hypothetical protein